MGESLLEALDDIHISHSVHTHIAGMVPSMFTGVQLELTSSLHKLTLTYRPLTALTALLCDQITSEAL